jgi:serine/threonine protein kinase
MSDRSKGTTINLQVDSDSLLQSLRELGLLSDFQVERITADGVHSLMLNDYVLLEPLGQGGMGIVYKARHRRMDRLVALKTLHPRAVEDADALDRFRREVKAAARLSHPNIVHAFDAGEQDGLHYLVMEYVEGIDFSRKIREDGVISARRAVHYIAQAAKGLGYAHKQGVIHRDIKPQNLLVDDDHKVQILDMGLARLSTAESVNDPGSGATQLTKSGVIMGTVDFMAPEQAANTRNANEQSDMYSLGCTLHFLLTGTTMYQGETFAERLLAHHNDPQPSLTAINARIPQSVEDVFFRMTAKQPSDRYASMEDAEKQLIRVFKELNSKNNRDADSVESNPVAKKPLVRKPVMDPNITAQTRIVPSEIANAQPVSNRGARDGKTTPPVSNRGARDGKTTSPEVETNTFFESGDSDVADSSDELVENLTTRDAAKERGAGLAARTKTIVAGGALGLVALIVVIMTWPDGGGLPESPTPTLTPATIDVPNYDWPNASRAKSAQLAAAKSYGMTPFVKNTKGMIFAMIPPGGSQRPFLMLTTEVTIAQFGDFIDTTGYELEATDRFGKVDGQWRAGTEFNFRNNGTPLKLDFPACSITFYEAQAFCAWLSKVEGARYRLPTVEEWSRANMAFATGTFFWGEDASLAVDFAWIGLNSNRDLHSVATRKPNAFGLFDMIGNESEWCGAGGEWAGGLFNEAARFKFDERCPQLGGNFASTPGQLGRDLETHGNPSSGFRGAFRIVRELDHEQPSE